MWNDRKSIKNAVELYWHLSILSDWLYESLRVLWRPTKKANWLGELPPCMLWADNYCYKYFFLLLLFDCVFWGKLIETMEASYHWHVIKLTRKDFCEVPLHWLYTGNTSHNRNLMMFQMFASLCLIHKLNFNVFSIDSSVVIIFYQHSDLCGYLSNVYFVLVFCCCTGTHDKRVSTLNIGYFKPYHFTVVIEAVCGTEDITFFPFYSAVFSSDDFRFKSRWF